MVGDLPYKFVHRFCVITEPGFVAVLPPRTVEDGFIQMLPGEIVSAPHPGFSTAIDINSKVGKYIQDAQLKHKQKLEQKFTFKFVTLLINNMICTPI